jgi:hypothetical protein
MSYWGLNKDMWKMDGRRGYEEKKDVVEYLNVW